jgi:energy-converting hydrogenase A subunit M
MRSSRHPAKPSRAHNARGWHSTAESANFAISKNVKNALSLVILTDFSDLVEISTIEKTA